MLDMEMAVFGERAYRLDAFRRGPWRGGGVSVAGWKLSLSRCRTCARTRFASGGCPVILQRALTQRVLALCRWLSHWRGSFGNCSRSSVCGEQKRQQPLLLRRALGLEAYSVTEGDANLRLGHTLDAGLPALPDDLAHECSPRSLACCLKA